MYCIIGSRYKYGQGSPWTNRYFKLFLWETYAPSLSKTIAKKILPPKSHSHALPNFLQFDHHCIFSKKCKTKLKISNYPCVFHPNRENPLNLDNSLSLEGASAHPRMAHAAEIRSRLVRIRCFYFELAQLGVKLGWLGWTLSKNRLTRPS